MKRPRNFYQWIYHTAMLFNCDVIYIGDKMHIKYNGEIAETYELWQVKSWDLKQCIETFERISGKKQSDLWETK